MSNIQTVNFHNQTLSTLEIDNVHYVAMKPICENIGLNWNAQFERIKRDEVLSSTVRMTRMVAEDGKNRELVCLPIQYLNGWLFGIDVSRVKAEIKDKLIMYKKECYQVLHDYWTKGIAFNPRLTSEQTLALRDAANMATGVLKLDYSTIYKMVHQRFGVDEIKELSREQIGQAVEYVHHLMVQNGQRPEQELLYNEMWRKIGILRHQENQAELHQLTADLNKIADRVAQLTKLNSVLYDAFIQPHQPSLTHVQRQYAEQEAKSFLQHNRLNKQFS